MILSFPHRQLLSVSTLLLASSLAPTTTNAYVEVPVVPDPTCAASTGGLIDIFDEHVADIEANLVELHGAETNQTGEELFDDFASNTRFLEVAINLRMLSSDLNITEPPDEFVGPNGEYTDQVRAVHEDIIRFWGLTNDIGDKSVIPFKGYHPSDLENLGYFWLTAFYQIGFLKGDEANATVDLMLETIETAFPDGFNNPLLTFNAAFGPIGGPQIVWGDGILESVANGVGKDDPLAISVFINSTSAHEYGHYIQSVMFNMTVPGTTVEGGRTVSGSRYLELQADAFEGYYSGHPEGGNFQDDVLCRLYQAARDIGDCEFVNVGGLIHHGTPEQRACAVTWASLQAKSDGVGNIVEPSDFIALYDEVLPQIVAVDRTICPLNPECGDAPMTTDGGEEGDIFGDGSAGLESSSAAAGVVSGLGAVLGAIFMATLALN